jgi:cation diffusion facilitator family transporter
MSSHSSKKVIFAALIGNFLIFLSKLGGAVWTGSSAMMSEAIHSIVDCSNQLLLLHGIKRSKKPADEAHPFGYGKELYFWVFIVAILIFAVGSGVSLYEGIHKIMNPHAVTDIYINYIILGTAIIFEGYSWSVAYIEFNKTKKEGSIWQSVKDSKDPTIITVLFEDTAAMFGLVFALVGLFIGDYFGLPEMDGIASVLIGVILAVTAFFLAYESKGLLIGEAAHPELKEYVHQISDEHPAIDRVNEILTMHMGAQYILLNLSLDFHNNQRAGMVEETITEIENKIKVRYPYVKRIFIEAQDYNEHMANSIIGSGSGSGS